MTGIVTDFKRFAVHDGDGIRTTVFLKGCPLRCLWCHNPESLVRQPQIAYLQERCISCGACAGECPNGAHYIGAKGHLFDRTHCTGCGACVSVCPARALRLYGREMTVEEVLAVVREDRIFYGATGGITLSGGEPMAQPEFTAALLAAAKAEGLNTALDTCGDVPKPLFETIAADVDCFLYDIKHMDRERHRALTGRPNDRILDNYRYLVARGCRIEVRIPLVPGCNDDPAALDGMAAFLASAPPERVKLLPYHSYGQGKYEAMALTYGGRELVPPSAEQLLAAADRLRRFGLNVEVG